MDPQVRTSFIPKKPITTAPSVRRGGLGLFFFLAFVLFLGSILLAGGAFAYQQYLNESIKSKSDSLARARAAFEPATIQDLMRLDDRLKYAKEILDSHTAPSSIFGLLSASTLVSVSFNNFQYFEGPDGKPSLILSGQTRTFSEIALQSDELGKQRPLRNILFSGFTVNRVDGGVAFDVAADVDPNFVVYRSALQSGTTQPETTEEEATSVPATSTSTQPSGPIQ